MCQPTSYPFHAPLPQGPVPMQQALPVTCLQPLPNAPLSPEIESRLGRIRQICSNFLMQCDNTLLLLQSALSMEHADAATSNMSISGWFVSNNSREKNFQAAQAVDQLRATATFINQEIANTRCFSFIPLDTAYSGDTIRWAENEEHHTWLDWWTDGNYSSMASADSFVSAASLTKNGCTRRANSECEVAR